MEESSKRLSSRIQGPASQTSRAVRTPLRSALARDGTDLVILLVIPVVHSRSSLAGGLRPGKHGHTRRQRRKTHPMGRTRQDGTNRANDTLGGERSGGPVEKGGRSDGTNRRHTNHRHSSSKHSSRSTNSCRSWGTLKKVAVGVAAIKQLQAVVHFHVFWEHIVQEEQLTLIQRPVSLVEHTDGGGHGWQPSPAAQEGANLPEGLECDNNKQGTAMQP